MPSSQFVEDFKKAQQDPKPTGILNLKWGDCDAQFELLLAFSSSQHTSSKIITAVRNVADYPKNHEYLLFCPDDAPPQVEDVLQKVSCTDRKTVSEFLQIVSSALSGLPLSNSQNDSLSTKATKDEQQLDRNEDFLDATEDGDQSKLNMSEDFVDTTEDGDQSQPDDDDDSAASDDYYKENDDYYMSMGDNDPLSSATVYRDRLQADMRLVTEAGFELTYLGPLMDYCESYGYIAISIPLSELGIYEDVMNAWHVDPGEYLILIIHYPEGYKTYEDLQRFEGQAYDKNNVGMRVVASKNSLPTVHEAVSAFSKNKVAEQNNMESITIHEIFISKQLSALLEERLVPILRFRSGGLDWHGAETWFSDLREINESADLKTIPDIYYEPEVNNKWFPDIVTADHFISHSSTDYSFPLLAMQFLLRHFVRCTEFCLTCHRKLNLELEAIKPYTCERPLCLFQSLYLNTGFIEHEIMSQPYVVDLLISFCYFSARTCKLHEYPDGLALTVPFVKTRSTSSSSDTNTRTFAEPQYSVGFDYARLKVNFSDQPSETCPFNKDSWIVIKIIKNSDVELHCRVVETAFYPIITVDEPVTLRLRYRLSKDNKALKGEQPGSGPNWTPALLTLYNIDFDLLSSTRKCDVICTLLETLPTVKEMQNYLADHHPGELQNWVQRLSPAALRLFRWIVVTNRACIMQVDGDDNDSSKGASTPKQERLYGMQGYMQFRFAMGAPDKEQRFLNEVRKTTERLNLKYPTLFAWHGSPLYNWHMIIREGLHFKNADHGRAYGHGVYHASDAFTSEGYSGNFALSLHSSSSNFSPNGHVYWPNSVLNISSALALSEIVNAPQEFVCSNPYYVVAQLDWIQTRYLFVKCSPCSSVHIGAEEKPSVPHPQDPTRTPKGISGPIIIPASAVNRGRRVMPPPAEKHEAVGETSTGKKKFKSTPDHS